MLAIRNTAFMARIEVQQAFCAACSVGIERELRNIDELENVRLYPKDTLITFNFFRANKLSEALNALSEIGYTEKGEKIIKTQLPSINCNCMPATVTF